MNTSEFAKLCKTQRRTIHYYDKIGLLKPIAIGENGYREYSTDQLEQMDTIRILQSSGYTLNEIQEIMSSDIAERSRAFFSSKSLIEEKIAQLQAMKSYIEKREAQYQEYLEIYPNCKIEKRTLTYHQKDVHKIEDHFFSFLYDGIYDTFFIDGDTEKLLCTSEDGDITRSGRAITFFLRTKADAMDIPEQARRAASQFQFNGENACYLTPLPHMLIDEPGIALIRVIIFEKNNDR